MKLLQYFSTHDRLSELPDSLILEILSLMPTRDAVRTTILSKGWKDLWTRVPCLDFQVKIKNLVRDITFIHFVLLRWKGINIRKFKISSITTFDRLDSCVRFATEKKVEILSLDLPLVGPLEYCLPQCVYACSSIKELWIRGCHLEVQEKELQWDNLKTLYLEAACLSEDVDVIEQAVSSAPRLEDLELRLCSSNHDLKIESNTLKTLTVAKHNVNTVEYDPSVYTVLTIWAPKLQSLHLSGNAYSQCNLLMESLTRATLCFYEKGYVELQDTLLQILPNIPHIEQVTLSPCAFKMLGVMQAKHSFPPFPNVRKLKLDGGPITPEEIVGLAQMFPQVETLVIDWKLDDKWYPCFLSNLSSTAYKDSEAMPLLKQLTVEIIPAASNYDRSAFHSIFSFLRDHSTMLQKTVIRDSKLDELKVFDWMLLVIGFSGVAAVFFCMFILAFVNNF